MPDVRALDDAIEDWLDDLRGRGFSPNSIRQYASHMRSWSRVTCGSWPDADGIRRWKRSMRDLSLTTQHGRTSSLRMFYRWCEENGVGVAYKPRLPLPPRDKMQPELLSDKDYDWLVQGKWKLPYRWGESHLCERDRLIVATFGYSGIRNSELCHLKVRDLDFEHDILTVRHGKGRRTRQVLIVPKLRERLFPYVRVKEPDLPVFESRKAGRHIGPNAVVEVFQKLSKLRGKRLHAHMLRHAYATRQARSGQPVQVLASMLGHASIATTQIYLHLTVNDQRNEASKRFNDSF